MWPWNRTKACVECETLRAEVKRLEREIEDIADKVFHWMKRHSARATRDGAAAARDVDAAEVADQGPPPRPPGLLRKNGRAVTYTKPNAGDYE